MRLERPLGPYIAIYASQPMDPWIWTAGSTEINGPPLVTTTQGGQTCRKRLADAS